MKKKSLSIVYTILLAAGSLGAQSMPGTSPQAATYKKLIGGKENDTARSVIVLSDGYLVAGKSDSFSTNRDDNIYVIRLDKAGNKVWSKHYGTKEDESAQNVIETSDGFVIIGTSDKIGNDRRSVYMMKIDKAGTLLWERAYYANTYDYYDGNDLLQRPDGGFIIAATEKHPKLFNEQVEGYVVSTDAEGRATGQRRYGGDEEDYLEKIIAADGGYLLAGATESFGHGERDAYVIKIDSAGNRIWSRAFGGTDDDVAHDIIETDDGYIMVGTTDSFRRRYNDVYVVKMNKNGNRIWHKAYGGNKDEEGFAIVADEGGYVIAGKAESYSGGLRSDLYLFKIDANGKLLWERIYGGEEDDAGYDLAVTNDGYIVVGETADNRTRKTDLFIVKTDKNGKVASK